MLTLPTGQWVREICYSLPEQTKNLNVKKDKMQKCKNGQNEKM